MRRILYLLAALVFLLPNISISANQTSVNVFFNVADTSLAISGSIGNQANVPVTVNIAEYTDEDIVFSPGNLPAVSQIIFTKSNGIISELMPLSKNLQSGKYKVYFYSDSNIDDARLTKSFIYFNSESSAAKNLITQINSASSSSAVNTLVADGDNAEKLGIDSSYPPSYMSFASNYAYNMRSQMPGGFTVLSFYDTFSGGIAAAMMRDKKVDEALANYHALFGITYEDYAALPSAQKNALTTLLEGENFSGRPLPAIYSEMYALSAAKTAPDRQTFRTIVTGDSAFGVDLTNSDYLKIPDARKSMVFSGMYDERSSYGKLSDVEASFKKHVASVLRDYENSSNPSSPSSPGSSSSTISSSKDLLKPEPATPQPSPPPTFNDTENHFAHEYVQRLSQMNVINGFPDGSFRPASPVTRAEFSKMIAVAFELEDGEHSFSDVLDTDWFAPYAGSAAKSGLVMGADGKFMPHNNLTREDAAVILHRLCEYMSVNLSGNPAEFADAEDISGYAKDAVFEMSASNILKGDGTNFYPRRDISRGEVAALICRVYDIIKGSVAQ